MRAVRSRHPADQQNNGDAGEADRNGRTDGKSQNAHLPWHKRLWFRMAHQQLPGRRALFRLRFCVCFFLVLTIMFLIGGGFFLSFSLKQVQIRVTYSGAAPLDQFSNDERSMLMQGQNVSGQTLPVQSNIDILVEHDMDEPIYIYYILRKFHQNHKRYVKSVDWQQVHGKNKSASSLKDCKGQKRYVTDSKNETLEQNGLVTPCGLIAWSYFNDTFSDFKAVREDQTALIESIVVDSDRLAWSTDRQDLFGNYEPVNHNSIPAFRGGKEMLLNVSQDEQFMVWMRPAAHADVRKYYGVIRTDLKEGDRLQFSVTHQYNTYEFGGEKELLFTTSGPFGNRNVTFGIVWLVMGGLTGCITLAYIVLGWDQIWSIERRVANLQHRWLQASAEYHLATYPYPDGMPPGKTY
eukprot:jgi/Ulvmu1/380/UM001_0387.1